MTTSKRIVRSAGTATTGNTRALHDLLTTAEILLMLRLDPHWTLPAGCHDADGRMGKAMAVIEADCVRRYWQAHDEMLATTVVPHCSKGQRHGSAHAA